MTNQDPFMVIHPPRPLPGCLVVSCKESKKSIIQEIQENPRKQKFVVRGIISDHIPLSGGISDIIERSPNHLLKLNENPLTIYLHHGGNNAVYFDLVCDEAKILRYIEGIVEATYPLEALVAARTEINNLLDTIVKILWMPLVISRLELSLEDDQTPILYQFLLPFNEGVSLGPLGGFYQFLGLSYDSLIREAVSTTSPYYRFLCAFRLYDGVRHLRKWLRDTAKKLSINASLPKDPLLDHQMLRELGLTEETLMKVKTVNDLYSDFKEHRNRIAHFLLKGERQAISFSDGLLYSQYALGGAVFLHYAHMAVSELVKYFKENLEEKFRLGSILPLKENRANFIIRSNQ